MTPLLLATTLVLSGAPGTYPEALTRPLLAKVEPFVWPKPEAFTSGFDRASAVANAPLLLLLDTSVGQAWYVVEPGDAKRGTFELWRLVGGDDVHFTDSLDGSTLTTWRYDRNAPETVSVLSRAEATIPAEALAPATYVQTLLDSSGPVYAEDADGKDQALGTFVTNVSLRHPTRAQFTEMQKALELMKKVPGRKLEQAKAPTSSVDEFGPTRVRIDGLGTWAEEHKTDDALYERFRHYRPHGTCSMDTHPQTVARIYGALASARGDLGRFLRLQLDIMGDRFSRTAWSSWGEAAHSTEADRLLATGLDLDQFFLGLAIGTRDRGPELSAWRLARSVNEAGRAVALLPKFEALARSPTLDPANRVYATKVWFHLQVRDEVPRYAMNDSERARWEQLRKRVISRALDMPFHPLARQWLTQP